MSGLTVSSALLRTSIVAGPPRHTERIAAWESGAVTSLPAEKPQQMKLPFHTGPRAEMRRQLTVHDRRKRLGKRREMCGRAKLPNHIRAWFTEGECAVLTVIGQEVLKHGQCELTVEAMAARAGVGVRTVQYTLATARTGSSRRDKGAISRPALIQVEYRRKTPTLNDPNVITIVSKEWLLWLNYRPSEAPASGCTEAHGVLTPSSTLSLKSRMTNANRPSAGRTARPQGAWEKGSATARRAPG